MPGYCIALDAGEGICTKCGNWTEERQTIGLNASNKKVAILAHSDDNGDGVHKVCKSCVESLIKEAGEGKIASYVI